jgi:laccase
MSWGMNTVFIVKNGATTDTSIRQPPVYMPSCKVPLKSWIRNNDGLDEEMIDAERNKI